MLYTTRFSRIASASALFLGSFLAMSAQAQDIKTVFVPTVLGKHVPEGTYGYTKEGGFVCYGTLAKETWMGLESVEYKCQGKKSSLGEHVQATTKGAYLGSTFLYTSPTSIENRGLFTIGGVYSADKGNTPGISGVLAYYR